MFEFHISRKARDFYQFDQTLFSTTGNIIFANFQAAKIFASKINQQRDLIHNPQSAIHASQINAMGLIDEIMHVVIERYRQQNSSKLIENAMQWLNQKINPEAVERVLYHFAQEFPSTPVYQGSITLDEYFRGSSITPDGERKSNQALLMEELIILWLANRNPAFSPFSELFDDTKLNQLPQYQQMVLCLHDFLETQPYFGPDDQNLLDMLRSPAIAVPHSLAGQLEYIRKKWGYLLGDYLLRLLTGLDFIKEEEKAFFQGPGPALIPQFTGLEYEAERFSQDKEWMPNLVLLAKNAYVWLDQLSKKYQRSITYLHEIPDEELSILGKWGFTGLWLIGLWERSPASKRIKQLRGNQDAVASAYSLFDYQISSALGGEESLKNFQQRAWKYGIRLASDMVPNHMGIDSLWVVEHPDWFISLDYSPFPSYSFNGPDLSWNERVGIQIEDHYFDDSDAAVVFKRVDRWTGNTRYIYHGNDGTSMPWNDTAQLNFLKPEVREAVIQTILQIARRFPVIRFDAAMTLAKKHFQRLWYPVPGSGGDIPSRAGTGMTREQFNQIFPVEFWREVVDRIREEVPDTLLLAEAFWLMEGYFVRTLGMHRVYNSAFMNMLRDEKNQEYRQVIKNTLEFDPEILKRYVNFMNNPDERTAVDQFGKGDKYFGICTLMATMPGLPMFGHGQVEGFTERYGMEYQRAYWDEHPDQDLISRHEREIFPLMHRRRLFAHVDNFYLYDFYTAQGNVNEDVFAYSNRLGEERTLVVYHNKFSSARGWIRTSVRFPLKVGEKRTLETTTLGAGLSLPENVESYVIFRDHTSGLEFIRNCHDLHERGLYVELDAYKYHVFLNFRIVQDDELRHYFNLTGELDGKGVPNIEEAIEEMLLKPVQKPFRELINIGQIHWIIDHRVLPSKDDENIPHTDIESVLDEIKVKAIKFLLQVQQKTTISGAPELIAQQIGARIFNLLHLPVINDFIPEDKASAFYRFTQYIFSAFQQKHGEQSPILSGDPCSWGVLVSWSIIQDLGMIVQQNDYEEISLSWLDEWKLKKILLSTFSELGATDNETQRYYTLVKLLVRHHKWAQGGKRGRTPAVTLIKKWLSDPDVQGFIGVNRYQDKIWFNKECFEDLLWWLFIVSIIDTQTTCEENESILKEWRYKYKIVRQILKAEKQSGYELDKLVALLEK
ncbi:MAG: alpha-amylase [Anaerolineales bacterium]|nr:alpha-amylase [Anaerolineales bacterium]